jgi:hypothetical protein
MRRNVEAGKHGRKRVTRMAARVGVLGGIAENKLLAPDVAAPFRVLGAASSIRPV